MCTRIRSGARRAYKRTEAMSPAYLATQAYEKTMKVISCKYEASDQLLKAL